VSPKIVVVKVGGSLFVQPQFAVRLQAFTARLSDELAPVHLVLIAGGGVLVDGLRTIDRVNSISPEFAHWAAIELTDVNARLLQHLLPQLHTTNCFEELQTRCSEVGTTLFCVAEFLRISEPHLPGIRLPASWDVTSDSIAARVTEVLNADELVLLKSVELANKLDWDAAAKAGVVDPYFPAVAANLKSIRATQLPHVQNKA
jgi:5-(aminomethyl)-3-furanmethanol phosphate kinase